MGKTKKEIKQLPRCPKCGGPMKNVKRKNAGQCWKCKRKQQNESSYEIKKRKRGIESLERSREKAIKTGADEQIEAQILSKLEDCIKDLKNPTKEDMEFLKGEIIYDFEKETLPERVRDKELTKLRDTRFKDIFKDINSLSSSE